MNSNDIDTVTDEDIAYWKSMDFSNAKRANEIPIIKALQSNSKARAMYAQNKQQVTLRLDRDVLAFFKKTGKGYQTRLNAVLRTYMEANQ